MTPQPTLSEVQMVHAIHHTPPYRTLWNRCDRYQKKWIIAQAEGAVDLLDIIFEDISEELKERAL